MTGWEEKGRVVEGREGGEKGKGETVATEWVGEAMAARGVGGWGWEAQEGEGSARVGAAPGEATGWAAGGAGSTPA